MSALRINKMTLDNDGNGLISNDDDSSCSSSSGMNHETEESDDTSDNSGSGAYKEEKRVELAQNETAHVFRLRLAVFIVLFLAGLTVSIIVYFITDGSENEEAVVQYEGASEKIVEAFVGVADRFVAVSSLGVASIAHGVDHIRTWPFVTLSSFQERSAAARSDSGALYVQINPLVTAKDRNEWEHFVMGAEDRQWLLDGLEYQETTGLLNFEKRQRYLRGLKEDKDAVKTQPEETLPQENTFAVQTQVDDTPVAALPTWTKNNNATIRENRPLPTLPIWTTSPDGARIPETGPGPYYPVWQTSPIFFDGNIMNLNDPTTKDGIQECLKSRAVMIGEFQTPPVGDIRSENPKTRLFARMLSTKAGKEVPYQGDPISHVFFPIFDSFQNNRTSVAVMMAWIHWARYFVDILPSNIQGIDFVLRDSCGHAFTYRINGGEVVPLGEGDLHDTKHNDMRRSASFDGVENIADGTKYGLPLNQDHCRIVLDVYPSNTFYSVYDTNTPVVITVSVLLIFVFTVILFIGYDRLVERRQAIVLRKAEQTTAIVSSLFPQNVADRLMEANDAEKKGKGFVAPNRRLKSFLTGDNEDDDQALQPIADLFPDCTVMFADISGFTAWSSTRDPAQVFILLQTVYQAFDVIAKRRKVFKVETIGDSYMAVTGLPEPQANHAVLMARFAGECLVKMNQLVAELEKKLGPDTSALRMRFGMHSGPVTAGVLRGERARFQLFGDTVNTAARMESTGQKNRIQISTTTSNLLTAAGKGHWVVPRADAVEAKGKGKMNTFWLTPNAAKRSGSVSSGNDSSEGDDMTLPVKGMAMQSINKHELVMKHDRLVDWMAQMLKDHIKKIIAQRSASSQGFQANLKTKEGGVPLDEVAEVIILPRYDATAKGQDYRNVQVSPEVMNQLREYISIVASTYHDNPFHNFEHACHVAMATEKFIRRIVAPDIAEEETKCDLASKLHDYTHGINSDPLTVLAIIFSALVHDADHRGVSNVQLAKEEQELANIYSHKSIAEQNSLDISWNLLMMDQFKDLRACLFTSEAEMKRFRQVLVNVVLATDIFDKELNDLRKNRWQKAFSQDDISDQQQNDLRATIVIEHIIQASDVSHTMQHWHIYRKWNKCLFREMHAAFSAGRMGKDPSEFWYQGELGFFDNYIIPLAKKLKDCNVFGVSSDECLNYAQQNRAEWADRGQEIVAEMIAELTHDTTNSS